ncbi:hypothetical protein MHB50_20420 [Siminovitchia sp. FSL H7-0308]|uniref:hypothetical protein n=1 Tax=Siminovitchia sp. FSL H7-0308 TaxID=2921432 RepID=UPI0030EE7EBF
MSILRIPKFINILVKLLFILLFTYAAFNFFVNGVLFKGVLFSAAVILSVYWLAKETFVAIKKKSIFKKEVVLDKFLMERLKTSLSLSYLYLIVHLSISMFSSEANNLLAFKESATFALFVSFTIFMFSQVFQAFIYYSKE